VTGDARSSLLPEVPTVIEAGLPLLEATTWYGLMVPAGVPKNIINRLNAETLKALKQPLVLDRLDNMDIRTSGSTPEQFAAFIRTEVARWGIVVKASGAKPI